MSEFKTHGYWLLPNYSCKKFSPTPYPLAVQYIRYRQTNRQMNDNHDNSSNVMQVRSAKNDSTVHTPQVHTVHS